MPIREDQEMDNIYMSSIRRKTPRPIFGLDRHNLLCPVQVLPHIDWTHHPTNQRNVRFKLGTTLEMQTFGTNSDITRVTSYWYGGYATTIGSPFESRSLTST